ncbi:MAG TPA: uroporphyrinogen-III synthase [Kineosporiaceae bacterium]|nr:uroporphyrinogen-III synthase [Kineosporiaceae bacterium]
MDDLVAEGPALNPDQLAGFTVVLTSDRRSEEFAASFARRGATALRAPTLRIMPLVEDVDLHAATLRIIDAPPDAVVVTTGIGLRGWVEAADAFGLAPDLLRVLGRARLLARGPKARGAIRAAGLAEDWAATSETTAEVVDRLLADGVAGRRVVLQLHGLPDRESAQRLVDAGAVLDTVQVYRWAPSPDPAAVGRAIDAVCARTVDAVVFTSAPGSQAFLDAARSAGRWTEVVRALAEDVTAAAVGPMTAAPLREAGVEPLVPDRYRLGALVRVVAEHLAEARVRDVSTAGGLLHVRGQTAMLDGRPLGLSPAPMAMLRALSRHPGQVLSRDRLLAALPGAEDPHAVEVAIARVRSALAAPGVVETVIKRGYRLAVLDERPVSASPGWLGGHCRDGAEPPSAG